MNSLSIRQFWSEKVFLASIWLIFSVLVINGIHGSSIPLLDEWWAPDEGDPEYVLAGAREFTEENLQVPVDPSFFFMKPRAIRGDEWVISTPYALSQLAHEPQFPVINHNIGEGQNMLITGAYAPVWHIVSISRPVTWGFLFFGAASGLAWAWWFPLFSCFTSLYFLGKILFRSPKLAVLFGIWYCMSSYVLLWSVNPATVVAFAASGCVCFYYLFSSQNKYTIFLSGIGLGLAIPAFIMFMYPPWQVSLAYLFICVFVALFIQDSLYSTSKIYFKLRIFSFFVSAIISIAITTLFIAAIYPSLNLMLNTVYPGKRLSLGGDYGFIRLFIGFYNVITNYKEGSTPLPGDNQSELSSFFIFFPVTFIVSLLYKNMRKALPLTYWVISAYLVVVLFYLFIGFPEWLSRITLFSFVPSFRATIALGLASIISTIYIARAAVTAKMTRNNIQLSLSILSLIIMSSIVYYHAYYINSLYPDTIDTTHSLIIAILSGYATFSIIGGYIKQFTVILVASLIATSAFFNPLTQGLDYIYDSEAARAIANVDKKPNDDDKWICYGGKYFCYLVIMSGRNGINSAHWYPHREIWNHFDSNIAKEKIINRYAHVLFIYDGNSDEVTITNPLPDATMTSISPTNAIIRDIGIDYIIAPTDYREMFIKEGLQILYEPNDKSFSIYKLPNQ